jgi:transketolase
VTASPKQLSPDIVRRTKSRLLRMHFESGVGHIGGNLSVIDLLLTLYHRVMGPDDQFILSKGHAAGALYATLWSMALLTEDDLLQFHRDGTRLSAHPPMGGIPEIIFATGSLGHGLGLSAGLALAKKLRGEPGRVFCVTSDGEWNEGWCWESLVFAVQRRLDNLVVIVDANGLQGFGTTREVADLEPLQEKFRVFGADVATVNGHDHEDIHKTTCGTGREGTGRPLAVIARTHKGCGVDFMQDKMEWHYLPMSPDQYRHALRCIGAAPEDTPSLAAK